MRQWSLTTPREKLVKIEAKVTRHSSYVAFHLAEVAVPRQLFASIPESGSGGLRFRSRSLPPAGSLYCGFGLKSLHQTIRRCPLLMP